MTYSVLKVPLNPNQPTNQPTESLVLYMFKYTRNKASINGQKEAKTKHAKSPVASASCPVRNLSSTRVV